MRVVMLLAVWSFATSASAGEVRICATDLDIDDSVGVFLAGSVIVPNHAVFEYSGRLLENMHDPVEPTRSQPAPSSYHALAAEPESGAALITQSEARLTRTEPCAIVPASAALSASRGWDRPTLPADPRVYFQIFGVLRAHDVDDRFTRGSPFDDAANRGEISATVVEDVVDAFQILRR
jgi:hypothetical protein